MTWSICSESINMHWNRREFPQGMPPIYQSLMPHLDIMVYNVRVWSPFLTLRGPLEQTLVPCSADLIRTVLHKPFHEMLLSTQGDVDPSCSYVANQRCIDGLGAPVSEAWRPWK